MVTSELLSYLPYFAPRLDALGPHLPLLRPHLPQLLPVLPAIAPHAARFAPYVVVSANADVLLWYFGWVLRVPGLRRVPAIPGFPRAAAFLARRLPRYPARRGRRRPAAACDWDECDSSYIANAKNYFGANETSRNVQTSVREAFGSQRRVLREWRRHLRLRVDELAEESATAPAGP